jgi:hypothetical protein
MAKTKGKGVHKSAATPNREGRLNALRRKMAS